MTARTTTSRTTTTLTATARRPNTATTISWTQLRRTTLLITLLRRSSQKTTQIPKDMDNLVALISNDVDCTVWNCMHWNALLQLFERFLVNRQISIETLKCMWKLVIQLLRIVLYQCHFLTRHCPDSCPHRIMSILNKSLPALHTRILLLICLEAIILHCFQL